MDEPASPAEIIDCYPVPRVQLVVTIQIDSSTDRSQIVHSTARFISTVLVADRKLQLVVDPSRSHAGEGEGIVVVKPGFVSTLTAERLGKMLGVVREAATGFKGATLARVQVVPQS
jgi:hypothetical protein